MRGYPSHPANWKDPWVLTSAMVKKYLKNHHLAATKTNKQRARDALKKAHEASIHPPGKDISVQESAADRQFVFGQSRCAGIFSYVSTKDDTTTTPPQKDVFLMLVVTLTGHRIKKILKVFFDDEQVTFSGTLDSDDASATGTGKWSGKLFMQVNTGSSVQTALSQLVSDSGGDWSSNCRQLECAHLYLRLKYDEKVYPNGLPQISFEIQGYVPLASTSFTRNPFDILSNFIYDRKIGGQKYITFVNIFGTDNTADNANFNEAKNICDELVPLAAGGTETRYTCDLVVKSSESTNNIIDKILSSFGGQAVNYSFYNGTVILAPKFRTPLFTLSDDDLLSDVKINVTKPLADFYDQIGGTFTDPNKNWEVTDFPQLSFGGSNDYSGEEDLALPATTSPTMAMRLAKLQMYREKFDLQISFTAKFRLFIYGPGDNFYWPNADLGWDSLNSGQGKIFEIQQTELVWLNDQNGNRYLGYHIVAKENDSSIYAWTTAEEIGVTAMPSLNFPVPGTTSGTDPSSLTATSGNSTYIQQNDGTILPRVLLQWTSPTDAFVLYGGFIEIQFKKSADSVWDSLPDVDGQTAAAYVLNVQVGTNYDFRIRARQTAGAVGNYVTVAAHTVAGKSDAPSNVTSLAVNYTASTGFARLSWSSVTDSDLKEYRIRVTTTDQVYGSSTQIAATGATFYDYAVSPGTKYKFYVVAANNSSVESATPASVTLNLTPSANAGKAIGVLGLTYS